MLRIGFEPRFPHKSTSEVTGSRNQDRLTQELGVCTKSEQASKSKIELDACPNNQPIRAVGPCIVGSVTHPIVISGL
jgi:hypothetical protein